MHRTMNPSWIETAWRYQELPEQNSYPTRHACQDHSKHDDRIDDDFPHLPPPDIQYDNQMNQYNVQYLNIGLVPDSFQIATEEWRMRNQPHGPPEFTVDPREHSGHLTYAKNTFKPQAPRNSD